MQKRFIEIDVRFPLFDKDNNNMTFANSQKLFQ